MDNGIAPNNIKLRKHVIPFLKDVSTGNSDLELKYSPDPIENASATKLEAPMIVIELLGTFPATPPVIITNVVTRPSNAPKMNGRI